MSQTTKPRSQSKAVVNDNLVGLTCGVCRESLDSTPWGLALPDLTVGWAHTRCLGYPA